MNLSREQMLAEMGISPLWRLRSPVQNQAAEAQPLPTEPVAPVEPAPALTVRPEAAPVMSGEERAAMPPESPVAEPAAVAPTREEQIRRMDWDALRESVQACRACGLCEQRRQAVLGVGDVRADWLFIGEGPGAEEDVQGEPFVGQAGKLLDNMLAATGLKRGEDVYIANAVKCRPPGNRTPTAEEMAACRPYLERQIDLIQPKLIVLLGRAAVSTILKDDHSLAALRGKRFQYRGIPVLVTYHPAYLLRNLPEKAKAWEDLVAARQLMGEAKAMAGEGAKQAGF